jgi:hypothetical protein
MAGTNIQGKDVASYMDKTDSISDIDNRKPILPKKSPTNSNLDGISGLADFEIVTLEPPGTKQMSLYNKPPVLSETDRIEVARKSMEEYLNRDDGGEDWLRVMNNILEDGDDIDSEEDFTNINDPINTSNSDWTEDREDPPDKSTIYDNYDS